MRDYIYERLHPFTPSKVTPFFWQKMTSRIYMCAKLEAKIEYWFTILSPRKKRQLV